MIPNILTTVRLILVPIFAYSMLGAHNMYLAAAIFILSGITDVIDGYIARRFGMVTNFGKVYDPFVDKLMQITAVVCLAAAKVIPVWLLILVAVKELAMIVTGGILYLRKIVVYSNWYGKLSTVIFYAAVLILIIWRDVPVWGSGIIISVLILAILGAAFGYIFDTVKNYDKKRI